MGVSTTRPFEFSHVQSPGNGALLVVVSAPISGVAGAAAAGVAAGVVGVAGVVCADAFMPAVARHNTRANPLATLSLGWWQGILCPLSFGGYTSAEALVLIAGRLPMAILALLPTYFRDRK